MADRPIIFSAPMIRALLDGRKSMTRRVLKVQPGELDCPISVGCEWSVTDSCGGHMSPLHVPYAVGDRLWCREAHALVPASAYRMSDGVDQTVSPEDRDRACIYREGFDRSAGGLRWRSSIHMPRWASRLTLIVTDVRVQRLQDISEADAQAEGLVVAYDGWASDRDGRHWGPTARDSFRILWNDIHGDDAWAANPWCVALTFETHRCNIDQMPGGNHE